MPILIDKAFQAGAFHCMVVKRGQWYRETEQLIALVMWFDMWLEKNGTNQLDTEINSVEISANQ